MDVVEVKGTTTTTTLFVPYRHCTIFVGLPLRRRSRSWPDPDLIPVRSPRRVLEISGIALTANFSRTLTAHLA